MNFEKAIESIKTLCRECGGNMKPSKAIVNYHNIQHSISKKQVEFETNFEDCMKCEDCGHSYLI